MIVYGIAILFVAFISFLSLYIVFMQYNTEIMAFNHLSFNNHNHLIISNETKIFICVYHI